jgi:transcriptional regulator GlxA family with amidase domain
MKGRYPRVVEAEQWLEDNFREDDVIERLIDVLGMPGRTLKRRFKQATGSTLIERVQNLRIEEAKLQLETTRTSIDDVSAGVGYEDPGFLIEIEETYRY